MGGASGKSDEPQTDSNVAPINAQKEEDQLAQGSPGLDQLMKRPIMPFVLMAVWVGFLGMACCVYTIFFESYSDCHFKEPFAKNVGLRNWLVVHAGFSALEVLFAPYLQFEIIKVMVDPERDVREAFKEVMLTDITVWLYLVALIAGGVWSSLGNYWVTSNEHCNPNNWPLFVGWSGEFFCGFVIIYGSVWYFRDRLIGRPAAATSDNTQQEQQGLVGGLFGRGSQQAETPPPVKKKPWCCANCVKLFACLGVDIMGNVTYFCPAVGEFGDAVLAPASSVALKMMFNSNGVAAIGGVEEILPFTDIVPTATLAWILEICLPKSAVTRCLGMRPAWAEHEIAAGR
eukprot:CAMPEP_0180491822 /NCGR_PEP_ID=MMETSP1036_2-20121128/39851_1 /TAXON_ID=632150 /ORGANISM="Azadinium spinosum, Strain 3D9" /LENGTH=343 /DNA_ID=CAMNT_0022500103 /DNA_START=65 /DNA_END=1093 /DNA_ORIENTATION=+